jgi:folate-binding protein YgfZ
VGFRPALRYNGQMMQDSQSPPFYNALRKQGHAVVGCATHWPSPLHVVQLQGKDTLALLQNRSTNDVKTLRLGQGVLNTILEAKAHVQGIFACIRDTTNPDTVWLLWHGTPLPQDLLAKLLAFKVIEQVEATICNTEHGVLLLGPASGRVLAQASGGQNHWLTMPLYSHGLVTITGQQYQCYHIVVAGQSAFMLLGQSSQDAVALKTTLLGLAPDICHDLEQVALEQIAPLHHVLSLEAGWPQYGQEVDETTLLPQTGLEVASVSYTKGCYLGQETVARVKTYGAVQQALMGLTISQWPSDCPLPSTQRTSISIDAQPAGWITSVAYSPVLHTTLAMAYLTKHHRIPGQALNIQLSHSQQPTASVSVSAVVTTLPFWTPQAHAKQLLDTGLSRFASTHPDGLSQAVTLLENALALDPSLADACEALGVMYSRQGLYPQAIAMMLQLLTLDADRVMAHTNLSIYYLKLGDKEAAEDEKAKATVLGMRLKMKEAGLDPAQVEAKRIQREAAIRERVALFLEALQGNPDDPLGNFGLAMAYIELNELRLAIPSLEKTILAQPKHSVAYLNLGNCYNRLGQTIQAMDVYHRGVAVASQQGDRMPLQAMQQALVAVLNA